MGTPQTKNDEKTIERRKTTKEKPTRK